MLNIKVDNNIFELFPDLKFAFAKVMTPLAYQDVEEKGKVERQIIDNISLCYEDKIKKDDKSYQAYFDFYKSIGIKSKDISTPIDQVNRLIHNRSYKSIYPIIDIYLKIEYLTLVSFQAYDYEKISGELKYSFSNGQDQILTYKNEVKICKPGDLILKDKDTVIHSCYHGNCRKAMITENTKIVLFRVMFVPNFDIEAWKEALNQIKELNTDILTLSKKKLSIEI